MELNNADSIGAIDTDAALRVILLSGIIRWSLENVAVLFSSLMSEMYIYGEVVEILHHVMSCDNVFSLKQKNYITLSLSYYLTLNPAIIFLYVSLITIYLIRR